jgi:hypothetical protein
MRRHLAFWIAVGLLLLFTIRIWLPVLIGLALAIIAICFVVKVFADGYDLWRTLSRKR